MNLRRWDKIVVAIGDEFFEATVRKVGQEIRCEYQNTHQPNYSYFGVLSYKHKFSVRRRDEGFTWVRADDPGAIEAMKAARALR